MLWRITEANIIPVLYRLDNKLSDKLTKGIKAKKLNN